MAEPKIPLELPDEEAEALCRLLRHLTYGQITRAMRRKDIVPVPGERLPEDVAWSAIKMVERQFMEAGVCIGNDDIRLDVGAGRRPDDE